MPAVPFNTIPGNLLVPGFFIEINSGGSPFIDAPRLLLLGPKLAGGSATANQVIGPIQSEAEAIEKFGNGSVLVSMFKIARVNAPLQPIWVMPVADPAGAAAAGSFTLNAGNPLGVTGVAVMRVLGRKIMVQVNAADTAATTAAALAAAINAAGLPIAAAVDGTTSHKINLTCRHVGTIGNGADIIVKTDEPNVLTTTNCPIVALSGGTGVPALTTALTNLGDDEYDYIASPYADTTSLDTVKSFLNGTSGRWSPTKQLYGHYYTYFYDTLSNCVSLTNGRNDPHVTIMCAQPRPTPVWESAAAIAAIAALHLGSGPPEVSRPLQNLMLDGVLPADDRSKWFVMVDRQALYADGGGADRVDSYGDVYVDRVCTTYQQTAAGAPDRVFMDAESMHQIVYGVRYLKAAVLAKHSRQGLAEENPHNVASITTPTDIKATLIHAYNDLVALGIFERPDVFAQTVDVQINALNADRVDIFFPVDLVNKLRIMAVNETAYLQYRTASGAIAV